MALLSMMAENDHGLSDEGRVQAEELRQRIADARTNLKKTTNQLEGKWLRHLLKPDVVFASPFTRTVCTACIGLRDLLPEGNRLVLMKEAREQKNVGGADSTGVAVGEEIPPRVREDLQFIYQELDPQKRDRAFADFDSLEMDTSGVEEAWWGGITGDSEDLIHDRIKELINRLRTTRGNLPGGGGSAMVVGHSLFFRTLLRTFLQEPVEAWQNLEDPYTQIAVSLTCHVLPYCGVVGCLFEWDKDGEARIVEALPFLDTKLRTGDLPTTDLESDVKWPPPQQSKFSGCVCSRKGMDGCVLS